MGTLGIQPPQFKIPGNLNNLPEGLTSTLDPNKLKQLSPSQLDAIKNLPPEKLASLNNIPIDQIKNLDPNKLKDFTSKLPNSKDSKKQLDKVKKQIKDRKDQEKKKLDDIKKSLDDKKGFLKDQAKQSIKDNKSKLAAIATPILLQFIRAENIADLLIKKLEKDTKKQLQNKGTLIVENGVFTFTPSNSDNYTVFKNNFDRRVSNIKKAITTLNNIVTILNNIIKTFNIALTLIKLYIKIKIKLRAVRLAKLAAELGAPIPAKPTVGVEIAKIVMSIEKLQSDKKKIEDYQAIITSLQIFITIFKEMIVKIKIKIDRLQFNILSSTPNSGTDQDVLSAQLDDSKNSVPNNEDYISSDGRSYILKLVTLPNEQRQYQALDSFSKLKITQTAPSRIKTDAELLDEIKQILG
jgi:hypothetical protein